MGNCQAVDAAALVIQHPSGKQERMYWPVAVSEVMKTNPGHYVSLIIPLSVSSDQKNPDEDKTVRYTRVKLLRSDDTLVLGRAYRLVTTQEVMKVLKAKKHAKMNKNQSESGEHLLTNSDMHSSSSRAQDPAVEKNNKATRQDKHQRSAHKSWRPSLQSISESASSSSQPNGTKNV